MPGERITYSSVVPITVGEHEVNLPASQARILYVLHQNLGSRVPIRDLHKQAWPLPRSKVSLFYVQHLTSMMTKELDKTHAENELTFVQVHKTRPPGNRRRVETSYSLREDADIRFPKEFKEFFFKKEDSN